jgi:signal transduction histidine kinase
LIADLRGTNSALAESNAALERQYAVLLEARRVKDEFLANISHELRTPLTSVIGYISLMQEGVAGPVTTEQHETLTQVKGASEQLLGLISDLLELTSLRRGEVELVPEEFDANEPLRRATDAVGVESGKISMEVAECGGSPVMSGDCARVSRILGLLLTNAFKFTQAGRVHASLQVANGRARYTVSDTGIGIPSEAQQYIFEEFRQVDGTVTRQYGGSGLGLALARRLARLLDGDISVQSAAGSGATFVLDLPLRFAPAESRVPVAVLPGPTVTGNRS